MNIIYLTGLVALSFFFLKSENIGIKSVYKLIYKFRVIDWE